MRPLINVSGYTLNAEKLSVLQKEGWVDLPLREVAHIKAPLPSSVTIRLATGLRRQLDLTHLSADGYAKVIETLHRAARQFHAPHPAIET